MELFGYHWKRLFVLATSIVIISLTATSISHNDAPNTFGKVLQYVVLFVGVAGLVGTLQNNVKYLQWFMLLLAAMTVTKVAYIILAAFQFNSAADGWDIAVAVLLGVATVQTADIIREPSVAGYVTIGDPLLG